jgi:hypothetical protein
MTLRNLQQILVKVILLNEWSTEGTIVCHITKSFASVKQTVTRAPILASFLGSENLRHHCSISINRLA